MKVLPLIAFWLTCNCWFKVQEAINPSLRNSLYREILQKQYDPGVGYWLPEVRSGLAVLSYW